MTWIFDRFTVAALAATLCFSTAAFGVDDVDRPFVLWTQDEIDTMRDRLENDPEYAERVERTLDDPESLERPLLALWRYAVKDDAEAGAEQKRELLGTARSPEPRGAAQWLNVVRYDLLYDELSADERDKVEEFFRTYIDHRIFRNSIFNEDVFNDEVNYSRYHAHYHRIDNWLPNITFPGVLSANLMAAALADEDLIREVWDHYGSWRWYFDEYLTDGGFYGEEFGKQHALPGEMFVYCIALDNLGLGELGFDYRGRHGATMRGHIESMLWLTFPAVELHTDMPHFARMTHGDLRGPEGDKQGLYAFQDSIVKGYLPDGSGGIDRWRSPGAWGGERRGDHHQWDGWHGFTPKMQTAFWFELGHRQWPDAGFDYLLSHMRRPGEQAYQPSIYFGLEPKAPDRTRPPRAPSWVAERRGVAMLRAEESPDYWKSSSPALGVRLASPYAHDVFDNFALTGLYAYNRPIYLNRQIGGYARHWTRSVLSHAGVLVDAHEPDFTRMTTTRYNFQAPVKFLAMRSGEVYPDVDATRGLILTDQYLFDAFALTDEKGNDRTFRWTVHPLGVAELDEAFSGPRRMDGELGHRPEHIETATEHRLLPDDPQELLDAFGEVRYKQTDGDWHLRTVQHSPIPAEDRLLDQAWFEREIGVDLRMAAAPDSRVIVADTPTAHDPAEALDPEEQPQRFEVGGTSIIVQRTAPDTVFAALHEPFEGGAGEIAAFTELERSAKWGAWHIGGPDDAVNDRVYLRFDDRRDTVEVEDDCTRITFTDWALVRIGDGKVEVFGDVRRVRIEVDEDDVDYYHNGRLSPATIEAGVLEYDRVHEAG